MIDNIVVVGTEDPCRLRWNELSVDGHVRPTGPTEDILGRSGTLITWDAKTLLRCTGWDLRDHDIWDAQLLLNLFGLGSHDSMMQIKHMSGDRGVPDHEFLRDLIMTLVNEHDVADPRWQIYDAILRPLMPIYASMEARKTRVRLCDDDGNQMPRFMVAAVAHTGQDAVHLWHGMERAPSGRLAGRACGPFINHYAMHKHDRKFVIPRSGNVFIHLDFSAMELRVLAQLSGDRRLRDAFLHGRDVHMDTARHVFGDDIDDVDRDIGKAINFQIVYRGTHQGLMNRLGCTDAEARQIMDHMFDAYPGILSWRKRNEETFLATGYAESAFGRRRYIDARQSSGMARGDNHIIQSTANTISMLALLRLSRICDQNSWNLVLHHHDGFLVEVPIDEAREAIDITSEACINFLDGTSFDMAWEVPMDVSVNVSDRWLGA